MPNPNTILDAKDSNLFDVLLFTHDVDYADAAIVAGINGIIVDWECSYKDARQKGWNTEINRGTDADLIAMRRRVPGHVVCRINNEPGSRKREARYAAELGANEIWLPMVRTIQEVEECLEELNESASLGILVETAEALKLGTELAALPISRIYVGLNDLQIDTGRPNLFAALCDGTIDEFRRSYTGNLGFAGVTRPGGGHPVPCRLLLAEMARQSCQFAVARRSFRADVPDSMIGSVVSAIRDHYQQLSLRDGHQVADDHAALSEIVANLPQAQLPAVAG